ncbi:peptidoglycan DD-metalloendopeptidase family protein [Nocardioides daeguensis]|uniref:M23ase beta-sheet core domain-containing protein n=1 Tax=Nocardioides daeguensis TaxID=908359 RepID=A0ABP6WBN5_9ACTN|nr:M23 family metallopeptidase [Nocardioides daeguensis]MBV6729275.1 peptidoglycan DD-metalloendopeptidase family protein [Nocardioides daeguensis]MCR1774251.1 peptidoglycan DD-metalloendopeptidase family protein [Nocardioides daeguensis]
MRFFPSAPWLRRTLDRLPVWAHPQWLVTAVAALVAVAGLAMPLAHADDRDDLKNKQDHVKGEIASVKGEIHEASQKVAKIARRLEEAEAALGRARDRLASVQADLGEAQAAAAALATQLADAQNKLAVARAALAQARADVAAQRDASRDTLIGLAQQGDARLALLAAYADAGTIEDVLMGETTNELVVGRQNDALVALVAAEDALEEQRAAVRAARDEVAAAKAAADANVARVAALVEQAAATENKVAGLVARNKGLRKEVLAAREADRAALRRLEKREAAIRQKIIELSKKQGGSYNGDTSGLLARPGPGPVTSPYGYRIHPIYGYWGLHNGTDFGTGCGAALWAGESGTVIDEYYDEIYGNRLYLAIGKVNGADIVLVYNHLSKYAVREGAKVARGQVVGYSGSTGWSTGCHLHFIVMRNGDTVDPMQYL